MRKLVMILAAFACWTAYGQSTNDPPARPQESFQAQIERKAKENPAVLKKVKPNEIVSGKVTYAGIAVQAVKTGHPLQLLNPFAPAQYGSPEDNVSRDVINGKVIGLKFFSLRF